MQTYNLRIVSYHQSYYATANNSIVCGVYLCTTQQLSVCTCVYKKHTHLYKHRHSGISLFRMQIDFEHKIWIIQSLSYNTHQFIPYKSDKADLTWDMAVYVCMYIYEYLYTCVLCGCYVDLPISLWLQLYGKMHANRQAGRLTNTV